MATPNEYTDNRGVVRQQINSGDNRQNYSNEAAHTVDGHLEYRMDETSNVAWIYFGSGVPGFLNADPVCTIYRMDTATGNTYYADGDSKPDNVWDDRTTLTYSTGV